MNKNLSDVTVILDRSGSMESCRTEAENGVNHARISWRMVFSWPNRLSRELLV